MIIYSGHSKRWWNQRSRRLAVRPKRLAVEIQFRVEFSRSPTHQHFFQGCIVNTEQRLENSRVGRERNDLTDIEITIGPTIQPVANA